MTVPSLRNPRLLSILRGKTLEKNAKPSLTDRKPEDGHIEGKVNGFEPTSVPYPSEFANLVQFVGSIGEPLTAVKAKDGVLHAISVLVDRRVSDIPHVWIPIIFQGELAESAISQVREEDRVYVTGQLRAGGVDLSPARMKSTHQVHIHTISFLNELKQGKEVKRRMHYKKYGRASQTEKSGSVEPSLHFRKGKEDEPSLPFQKDKKEESSVSFQEEENNLSSISDQKGKKDELNLWKDLINNPQNWMDHRRQKLDKLVHPRFPDFKHKTSNCSLWLTSGPRQISVKIKRLTFATPDKKFEKSAAAASGSPASEHRWRSFVENMDSWNDNRLKKTNPRQPDFVHKETKEALWLGLSTPLWVIHKLPPLHEVKT